MDELQKALHGCKAAVLIVDVQNDYCDPQGALAQAGEDISGVGKIIPNLTKLQEWARNQKIPVIFVQTIHQEATDSKLWKSRASGKMLKICRPGSWGIQAYGVKPKKGDIIVYKHRYSAFINTPLDSILRAHQINTLFITGVATNICVESTARDAYMLDYQVVFLSDGSATFMKEMQEPTLKNISAYFGVVAKTEEAIKAYNQGNEAYVNTRNIAI